MSFFWSTNYSWYKNIWGNIPIITTGQGDDYTAGCFLDYNYFIKHYKMIAIDLSKQQAFDADPKAIQQISFNINPNYVNNLVMFFIIEEAKETILDFPQGNLKVW